jgi:hypothetical protein
MAGIFLLENYHPVSVGGAKGAVEIRAIKLSMISSHFQIFRITVGRIRPFQN